MHTGFDTLLAEINEVKRGHSVGRVEEVSRGTVTVRGLSEVAALGDTVGFVGPRGQGRNGEIIEVRPDIVRVLCDDSLDGISVGDAVRHLGVTTIAPDDSWIGRVVDPLGNPIDGGPAVFGGERRSLAGAAPLAAHRKPLGERLETGMTAFNTVLPLVRGQRVGIFAGSGVGKSTLLAKMAQGVSADIIVIALIGERGREVREFVEETLGSEGMRRAVVVAATSDQSPLMRRRCAFTAMSIAEHFRDQGAHVLLLADSITRFGEAHREVALASGESASLRGYPPSMSHMIMSLCERAGPGVVGSGDITAVFTVLVAGSDMDEPLADILRGVMDGHIVMDRSIAERGRYPAIDLLRSVSRSLPRAASGDENELINSARRILGAYSRSELAIQAGLYVRGSDAEVDEAIIRWPNLDGFLAEDEARGTAHSFKRLAYILGRIPNPN